MIKTPKITASTVPNLSKLNRDIAAAQSQAAKAASVASASVASSAAVKTALKTALKTTEPLIAANKPSASLHMNTAAGSPLVPGLAVTATHASGVGSAAPSVPSSAVSRVATGRKVATGPSVWSGPVVTSLADMTEAKEQAILKAAGGGNAVIASYGPFDPKREPILLVHGLTGNGITLSDFAKELQAEGKQVLVVFYQDTKTLLHKNGNAIAAQIVNLHDTHYPASADGKERKLQILTHSMAGIVTRTALNSLQNPNWMNDPAPELQGGARPRGGFKEIEMIALDAPWSGFIDQPEGIRKFLSPVINFFLNLFNVIGFAEMQSGTEMFQHLFEPTLEGVSITSAAADNNDLLPSVPDLSKSDRRKMVKLLLDTDAKPSKSRNMLHNLTDSIRQDSRIGALRTAIQTALSKEGVLPEDALVTAFGEVMGIYKGGHVTFLDNADSKHLFQDVIGALTHQPMTNQPAKETKESPANKLIAPSS